MRPPVLRGVKARQGGQLPITKRSAGDGAVAQVQRFDLGRRENMHLAGPDIAPVRAVRPHGIMVARGDKDLRWAFGQGLAQLVDGIAIDCAGIEEVPGQQHQAAARPAAEAGEKLQQLAGLLAALGGSVGALLGMRVWRHKTLHRSFRIGIPLILAVQILIPAGLWLYWNVVR